MLTIAGHPTNQAVVGSDVDLAIAGDEQEQGRNAERRPRVTYATPGFSPLEDAALLACALRDEQSPAGPRSGPYAFVAGTSDSIGCDDPKGDVMVAASEYVQSRPLGDMTVTAINDGTLALPVELTVPEEVWRQKIDADAEGKIPVDIHVLLIQTDDATILVDVGLDEPGSGWDQRFLEEWPGSWRTPGVMAGHGQAATRAGQIDRGGGAHAGAVLSRLRMLGHPDLGHVVLVHKRHVGVSSRVVCRGAAPASVQSA